VPNAGGFDNHWFASGARVIGAHVLKRFVSHRLRPFVVAPKFEDLLVLKELIEAGKVTPVIDRTYPLSEVPEAIRYLEEGHARGKVLISVRGEPERKTLVAPQAARMSPATTDQVPADIAYTL
jgi:hypothetical protein